MLYLSDFIAIVFFSFLNDEKKKTGKIKGNLLPYLYQKYLTDKRDSVQNFDKLWGGVWDHRE